MLDKFTIIVIRVFEISPLCYRLNDSFLRFGTETNKNYIYKISPKDSHGIRLFVQRFRANDSCVFQGKIQSGLVSCFIQTRGVI